MPKKTMWRPLPSVLDPPDSICFQVPVPNDPGHIQAFLGALFDLGEWWTWERDEAHGAKVAAQRWRKIVMNLLAGCPAPAPPGGLVEDFEMPLRVDCDCNVFVTCCDGTEKQILTSAQVKALVGSSTAVGAPQPQPGGGQACYHEVLNANTVFFLPTPVSAGDVIEIQNAQGATSNSHNANWYLTNGGQFFAGQDVGFPQQNGANPVPSADIGSLVVEINGTFYSLESGPFTVPGGVSNASALIQVNDNSLTGLSGTLQFDVCVTNNQAATFDHIFDLKNAPAPWHTPDLAPWVPGQGFETAVRSSGTDWVKTANVTLHFASRTITRVKLTVDVASVGSFAGFGDDSVIHINGTDYGAVLLSAGTHVIDTGPISEVTTDITVYVTVGHQDPGSGDPGGSGFDIQAEVIGYGTDPFS